MTAIVSDYAIKERLKSVSYHIGMPLKYRVLKVSGETWYAVDYAKGSTWGRLCASCKTQRVLWNKILQWEELALAVTDSQGARG